MPTSLRVIFRSLDLWPLRLGLILALLVTAIPFAPDIEVNAATFTPTASSSTPDLSGRYVLLLDGINSSSSGDKLDNDFSNIKKYLQENGSIAEDHFVYFSYRAAVEYNSSGLYCAGWGGSAGCAGGNLASLNLSPVYTANDTKSLVLGKHAQALDWLLQQIVSYTKQPNVQIDIVGYSLGGVIAALWGSSVGAESAIRKNVHSITTIESPVGGIPLGALATTGCGIDLVCIFWQNRLNEQFGQVVLQNLTPDDSADSIVSKLSNAARNFKFTSIQSTQDYLVNGTAIKVCVNVTGLVWGFLCIRTDKAVVGLGSQSWGSSVLPNDHLHFQPLGGYELDDQGHSKDEFSNILLCNHGTPLKSAAKISECKISQDTTDWQKTADWVLKTIQEPIEPDGYQPGTTTTISKAITTPPIPVKPDVVFLADTTGSMGGPITDVRAKATAVMNEIQAVQPSAQFGVAEYKDFGCDAVPYKMDQVITVDTTAVQNAINNNWFADGGCDTPEAQLNALFQLSTNVTGTGWRSDSSRIVAWFGDAPGHDPSNGHSLNEVLNNLTTAKIRVIAINVGNLDGCADVSCNQATAIAKATDGVLCTLSGGCSSPISSPSLSAKTTTLDARATSTPVDDVASAILAGLKSLPVTVTPQVSGCSPYVNVTFDPASQTVTSGGTANFNITISVVANLPPGAVSNCKISYLLDGKVVTDNSDFVTPIVVVTPVVLPPTLTSLSPTYVAAGGSAFTLVVNGANFNNKSIIRWNGSTRPTTFINSTQLTSQIAKSDIANQGTASITVFDPAGSGNTSNALTLPIARNSCDRPVLSQLSQVSLLGGQGKADAANGLGNLIDVSPSNNGTADGTYWRWVNYPKAVALQVNLGQAKTVSVIKLFAHDLGKAPNTYFQYSQNGVDWSDLPSLTNIDASQSYGRKSYQVGKISAQAPLGGVTAQYFRVVIDNTTYLNDIGYFSDLQICTLSANGQPVLPKPQFNLNSAEHRLQIVNAYDVKGSTQTPVPGVLDGVPWTNWVVNNKPSSATLLLDLGQAQEVTSLRYFVTMSAIALHTNIEYSPDGTNWASLTSGTGGINTSDSYGQKVFKLTTPVIARYVRFTITNPENNWALGGYGEIDVLGAPVSSIF